MRRNTRTKPGDRNFFCSLRLLWQNELTLRARRPRIIDRMRQYSDAWVARYPGDDASDADLIAYVDAYPRTRTVYLFDRHVLVTFKATNAAGAVAMLCAMKVKDPGLTLDLLSGVEGVESAEPARMLWTLARIVAASASMTQIFDQGVDEATWAKLRATPDAAEFVEVFSDFLDRYGYRGPNEWEFASASWRMRPHVPLEGHRPHAAVHGRGRRTGRRCRSAAAQLPTGGALRAAESFGVLDRLKFRKALPAARVWQIAREASKSSVIRALDRRAARSTNSPAVARKDAGSPTASGFYMLRWDEFLEHFRGERDHTRLMAERARDYGALAERIPPFLFEGEIPPLETWQKRAGGEETWGQKGDILEGIGGSPGRVTGRARIVFDTENPDVLEPGDILVAPITDPSWTPLFLAAAGVVVDVGAVMSHSVIVSRDLGIPCVVSVTDATRIIPDGAMIEIDGDVGTVTILASASPALV